VTGILARVRLTQTKAAASLAVGLLAVPGIPLLAEAASPIDDWSPTTAGQVLTVTSGDGHDVTISPPPGWQVRESANGFVLRSESGNRIMVQAYDRGGRDLDAVTRRLIRADRVLGANAALTDGVVSTTDGSLRGPPCVIVTVDETSGPCAFLADDDVVVSVQSLGSRAAPAPPLSGLLETISRSRP